MEGKHTEQAKIDYERLRSLSRQVQLRDVALVATNFQCHRPPETVGRDVPRAFAFQLGHATWNHHPESGEVNVLLVFDVRARATVEVAAGKPEDVNVFQLQSVWSVLYEIRPDADLAVDDDVMADFAFANGQLNVYPYVRQLVQDLTGRAGWPPLVMPVFTVPSRRPVGVVQRATEDEAEGGAALTT